MKRISFLFLILGLIFSSLSAQERLKPKPENEEEQTGKAGVIKQLPVTAGNPIARAQLRRKPPTRMGGGNFSVLDNEFMGFGASYETNKQSSLGISFGFYYFSVPGDRLYFDPYYYEFVQRNKGSMMMLLLGFKHELPIFRDEPNINPFLIVGVGPVLGIENDQSRSFPGSLTHAHSVGGGAGYAGLGVEYWINSWSLNFDARYQLTRFPNQVFGKKKFDGVMFNIGVGKLF